MVVMYSFALAVRNIFGFLIFALFVAMLIYGQYASALWMLASVWAGMVAGYIAARTLERRPDDTFSGKVVVLIIAALVATLAVFLASKATVFDVFGLQANPIVL